MLMPEELAPPVVAVVVSHDPGPWLEECLESLRAQDYPGLTVLVIDQASEPPLADRIAAVTPEFYLRRLETNLGFGPGANAVRGVVDGASHFVFCHDDVVLAPDAIRQMVEEAFRRNAGIIGPKLVDPDDDDRILQLGLGVDRFGAPVPRVERLEFDQSQHDEVQEVFAVPGGCILIRADLFDALEGFDDQISMFGEDVDLCWRARIAGAHAFVVPQAVVRHYEATASRRRERPDARALQWRHELRAVLKNYSRIRRTLMLGDVAMLSLVEIVYFYLRNHPDRARQVIDAWRWNFRPERKLKQARASVEATRVVSDFELRSLFSHRTSRAWRFAQGRVEHVVTSWSASGKASATRELELLRSPRTRVETYGIIVAVVALVIGSRSLLSGHLPVVGGYLPFPSPTACLREFFGGVPSDGIGQTVPASPALLLLGLAGFVTFGSMGLLFKVLLVASVTLGAAGIARLLRPFGNSVVRLIGVVAYLFLPLCWDDVATGDVLALVAFGAAPFVLARLLRATGIAPFTAVVAPSDRAGLVREIVPFALLLALLGSFVPAAAILTPVLALALGLGCAALGEWRAGLRALWISLAALVGAGVLTVSLVVVVRRALDELELHLRLAAEPQPLAAARRGAALGARTVRCRSFGFGALCGGILRPLRHHRLEVQARRCSVDPAVGRAHCSSGQPRRVGSITAGESFAPLPHRSLALSPSRSRWAWPSSRTRWHGRALAGGISSRWSSSPSSRSACCRYLAPP